MRIVALLSGMTLLVLAGVWHTAGAGAEPLPDAPPRGDFGPGFAQPPHAGHTSADVALWVFIGVAALVLLTGILHRYAMSRASTRNTVARRPLPGPTT